MSRSNAASAPSFSAWQTCRSAVRIETAMSQYVLYIPLRLLRQPTLRPIQVRRPPVVGCQSFLEIAGVAVHHQPQVSGSAKDVFREIKRILDTHFLGGLRHKLHQPHGSSQGHGIGIEIGLDSDNGSDQFRVELICIGGCLNQLTNLTNSDFTGALKLRWQSNLSAEGWKRLLRFVGH